MSKITSNKLQKIAKIKIKKNIVYIIPQYDQISIFDLYITLYSYILYSNNPVKYVYIISNDTPKKYYNVSSIINFSYIEFRLWWYEIEKKKIVSIDSDIFGYIENKSFLFQITFNFKIENIKPIYPWNNEIKKAIFEI